MLGLREEEGVGASSRGQKGAAENGNVNYAWSEGKRGNFFVKIRMIGGGSRGKAERRMLR